MSFHRFLKFEASQKRRVQADRSEEGQACLSTSLFEGHYFSSFIMQLSTSFKNVALIALLTAAAQAPGVAGFSPSGLTKSRAFVGKWYPLLNGCFHSRMKVYVALVCFFYQDGDEKRFGREQDFSVHRHTKKPSPFSS